MPTCPTVMVQDGTGYMIINESDFDPKRHTIYGAEKPELEYQAKPKPTTRKPRRKAK